MATSRTGTAKWKRVRAAALQQAQADGITRCPACRTHLDYERGQQPNSAEADHITPHSLGGQDTIENVRVLCRHCNQSRGNGKPKRVRAAPKRVEPDTRIGW